MIYDEIWWYLKRLRNMMIYEDTGYMMKHDVLWCVIKTWRYMMIFDDIRWEMIYGDDDNDDNNI